MENQRGNYDINGVILDSTCLLDVYLKINEKNDEYKKFYEQSAECLKPGNHENFTDDQDVLNRRSATLESSRVKWPERTCTSKTRKAGMTITSSQTRGPP